MLPSLMTILLCYATFSSCLLWCSSSHMPKSDDEQRDRIRSIFDNMAATTAASYDYFNPGDDYLYAHSTARPEPFMESTTAGQRKKHRLCDEAVESESEDLVW